MATPGRGGPAPRGGLAGPPRRPSRSGGAGSTPEWSGCPGGRSRGPAPGPTLRRRPAPGRPLRPLRRAPARHDLRLGGGARHRRDGPGDRGGPALAAAAVASVAGRHRPPQPRRAPRPRLRPIAGQPRACRSSPPAVPVRLDPAAGELPGGPVRPRRRARRAPVAPAPLGRPVGPPGRGPRPDRRPPRPDRRPPSPHHRPPPHLHPPPEDRGWLGDAAAPSPRLVGARRPGDAARPGLGPDGPRRGAGGGRRPGHPPGEDPGRHPGGPAPPPGPAAGWSGSALPDGARRPQHPRARLPRPHPPGRGVARTPSCTC